MIECECYTDLNKLPNIIGNLYENITEDSENIINVKITLSNNNKFVIISGSLYFFDDYLEIEMIRNESYKITRECLFKDIVSIEYHHIKEEW